MSKIIEKVRQREAEIAVLHARERFAGMMAEINDEPPLTMSRAVTMKHKTAELEGALLDAAVAKALGKKYVEISLDGRRCWAGVNHQDQEGGFFAPGSRWDHGGPIIERAGIEIWKWEGADGAYWVANVDGRDSGSIPHATGPTALIAAMRAFVASRYGDEVELP